MDYESLENLIQETVMLIAVDAKGLATARERAGRFLSTTAILVHALKMTETQMAKTETAMDATEASVIQGAEGKTITEKKNNAKNNQTVIDAIILHKELEAQRNWLKNYIRIFENAHLMYRAYSKEM